MGDQRVTCRQRSCTARSLTLPVLSRLLLVLAFAFPPFLPPAAADNFEPNDSPGEAVPIASGVEVESWLGSVLDADWYTFTTTQNGSITAALRSLPKDYDLALFFLDPQTGDLVQESGWTSERSGLEDESITATPDQTGVFFLHVYSFAGRYDAADSYLLSVAYAGEEESQPPQVTVLDPDGGEVLQAGSITTIRYSATDPDTPSANLLIDIAFSADGGGSFTPIATTRPNTGTFDWQVPAVETAAGRVRVSAWDGSALASDQSNQSFSIVPPPSGANTLEIADRSGPPGGEVAVPASLANGDAVTGIDLVLQFDPAVAVFNSATATGRAAGSEISTTGLGPGAVGINLSVPGGGAIAPGTGNILGLHFELIGAGGSSTALTPVTLVLSGIGGEFLQGEARGGELQVTSIAPVVRVVIPDGGETLLAGAPTIVSYTATDADTPAQDLLIDIEFSGDGGATWQDIAIAQENETHFTWPVPVTQTEHARIRVSASDGLNRSSDVSDGDFAIRLPEPRMNLLVVGTANGIEGETAAVALSLANEDRVASVQTDLVFDPGVVAYDGGETADRSAGMVYADSVLDASRVRIHLAYTNALALQPGSGAVARIRFRLLGPAGSQSAVVADSTLLLGDGGETLLTESDAGMISIEARATFPPIVTLVQPNGGEVFTAGAETTIAYAASDPDTPADSLKISLDVSLDGGHSWTAIAAALPNTSTYLWTVPAIPTSQGRVRVVASDGEEQSADVSTTDFVILPPTEGTNVLSVGNGTGTPGSEVSVAIDVANGDALAAIRTEIVFDPAVAEFRDGVATGRGSTMVLEFSPVGPNRLGISLLARGGTELAPGSGPVALLTYSIVGTGGQESALTPNETILRNALGQTLQVTAEAGRIRATETAPLAPSVIVVSPNGTETIRSGAQAAITYTASDPDTPSAELLIDIDLSTDGGGSWASVATSQSNDGLFAWAVPTLESAQCRIRVSASDGYQRVADISDGNFTLALPPSGVNVLTLDSENGAPGDRINVAFILANEDPVSRLSAEVVFDPTVVAYVAGAPAGRGAAMVYDGRVAGSDHLLLDLSHEGAATLPAGSGVIGVLTFDLIGSGGSMTALDPNVATLLGAGGHVLAIETSPGEIRVIEPESAPPALQLAVLKNPGRTRDLQLLVRSDRSLDGLTVSVGPETIVMGVIDAGKNLWQGTVRLSQGVATATVSAIGVAGGQTGSAQAVVTF